MAPQTHAIYFDRTNFSLLPPFPSPPARPRVVFEKKVYIFRNFVPSYRERTYAPSNLFSPFDLTRGSSFASPFYSA